MRSTQPTPSGTGPRRHLGVSFELTWPAALLALTVGLLAWACGDAEYDAGAPGGADYPPNDYEPGPTQDAGSGMADTGGGAPAEDAFEEPFIPEEPEEEHRFQPPAASRTFVFVANTSLNAVARIDSLTLQITTIEVGFEPTVVRTVPTGDLAVVLNEGSDDVSVIFADQSDRVVTVDVAPGANSLELSPNGDFAIAYYDDAIAEPEDQPGSLSDASLIRLNEPVRVFNLVVGLHIREIEYNEAGDTAYFVTDDGVAVVTMPSVSRDLFVPPVHLSRDRLEDVAAIDREVEIAGDGEFALVRSSTESTLRLVDLTDGRIRELDLMAIPTDLDLLPSGDEVVAVLRDRGELLVVPLPGGFEDAETVQRYPLGDERAGLAHLIPSRRQLALYSTLDENDHLTLFDLDDGSMETFALRKGIESVVSSPDGSRLVVFHTKLPGEPVPGSDSFLAQSFAYTVFHTDLETARLVLTEARPGAFTFSEDGDSVFMLLADESRGVQAVEWADLLGGRDRTIELRRMPEAIGVIPATGRVYVSEQHEVGRMAFIDTDTGTVREVTGYQLNSRTE
jgi:DNA-binding beta-propeller fold protein YncE